MRLLNVEQKLAKIMLDTRKIRPFYYAIYSVMKRVKTASIQTMRVNLDEILYNEKFIEGLDHESLLFINLHIIGHVALMHVVRAKEREPNLWNIACDLYVNKLLCQEFNCKPGDTRIINNIRVKVPSSMIYCDELDIDMDYTEKIYDELAKQADENGYSRSDQLEDNKRYEFSFKDTKFSISNKESGDLMQSDKGSCRGERIDTARRILSSAIVKNKMAGNMNSLLERLTEKLTDNSVKWETLLKRYLIDYTNKEYLFSRPDKRMYYQSAIYPGISDGDPDCIKGLKVCIDTSASISNELLAKMIGQVRKLAQTYKVEAELIYWNTEIVGKSLLTDIASIDRVACKGGGGTAPVALFEYFESSKCVVKPFLVVIITDGYILEFPHNYTNKYRKKTIWLIEGDNREFSTPFGVVKPVESYA